MRIDIVNIALHISLKNFEQQCNGYLFHCGGRRFARLIRVISAALLCRRHSAYRRAYPAVIPITHVVAPDHCFPCSDALPRFAAAGSPQPDSLRFRGFAPQCPGRRSLPPAPISTVSSTVPSVPRWLALLLFPAPALLTAPCNSCRISLLLTCPSPS